MVWETPVRVGATLYESLREKIVTGEMPPGTKLTISSLAKQYQVSRSPIRDAVLHLVREGLATEELNRGAVVSLPSAEDLVSLYHARECLEGMAARLATLQITPSSYESLEVLIDKHGAIDPTDFRLHLEYDATFHRTIRELAQSPELSRMLDEIQGRVIVAMRSTNIGGGVHRAVDDHREILKAVGSGKPDLAEKTARAHIQRLRYLLEERINA